MKFYIQSPAKNIIAKVFRDDNKYEKYKVCGYSHRKEYGIKMNLRLARKIAKDLSKYWKESFSVIKINKD